MLIHLEVLCLKGTIMWKWKQSRWLLFRARMPRFFWKLVALIGDDLVDLPIIINLSKDGVRQGTTHPIFVPYGHYTDEFIFKEPGIYALDVTILDDVYTTQNLTVTFPITVVTPLFGYFSLSSSSSVPFIAAIAIVASTIGVILIYKRKRRAKSIEHTKTTHEDRYWFIILRFWPLLQSTAGK